jgi:hypothetical protein
MDSELEHPCTGRIPELERKVGIISNRLYTLIYWEVRIYLYPLPGIAHKREVKASVPCILHPHKFASKLGSIGCGPATQYSAQK